MCGLAGFLTSTPLADPLQTVVRRMVDSLAHRGPNDSGVWVDANCGFALGHRRLSILDLTSAGHQPMTTLDGRYVIAFNGEIYNHLELRDELGEANWCGHSDTETLLGCFNAWGVKHTLEKMRGMFAIALWDRENRVLTLARDRFGEKPLYYGWAGGTLIFGSELKALRLFPHFRGRVSREALALFLRHNFVPSPWSIFEGVQKLPPGCFIQFCDRPNGEMGGVQQYWSLGEVAKSGTLSPWRGSEEEAVTQLDCLLRASIREQMVADVPLGAFFSGGIDSSTIVALMQAQSGVPVKTFTIGYHEAEFNEANDAAVVARHLGTDHTTLYVTAQDALDVIPRLSSLYDEPFADCSQVPTFLVSQLARQSVTVALSGDGGDELFCGYEHYPVAFAACTRIGQIPYALRRSAAHILKAISIHRWQTIMEALPLRSVGQLAWAPDKIHKLAELLLAKTDEDVFRYLISRWKHPQEILVSSTNNKASPSAGAWELLGHSMQSMLQLDQTTYLPDDILVKVDRAAMGVGLETRVPLLDRRVVEFSWCLPLSLKFRDQVGKYVLRQLLYRYVPRQLVERPKRGFGIPIEEWLRGPLRNWAESLLNESELHSQGYFRPAPIRKMWIQHLSGERNWAYYLWPVLIFQAWLASQEMG